MGILGPVQMLSLLWGEKEEVGSVYAYPPQYPSLPFCCVLYVAQE